MVAKELWSVARDKKSLPVVNVRGRNVMGRDVRGR